MSVCPIRGLKRPTVASNVADNQAATQKRANLMTASTTNAAAGSSAGMGDVDDVATLIPCSPRHVRRMADGGLMPRPVHVGRLVRWRLRTGNPTTGVLDWIEAGCPSCRTSTKARAT